MAAKIYTLCVRVASQHAVLTTHLRYEEAVSTENKVSEETKQLL